MTFENEEKTPVSDLVETKRKPGRPKKERESLDVEGIPDANFAETISKHESLVVLAREKYERMLRAGDAETGKYQVTYGQSLKQLVALQEESERRALAARDRIEATEAREAMLRLAGLIVERLDALASECGENSNPKDPIKAITVLTAWALEAREKIANAADAFRAPNE